MSSLAIRLIDNSCSSTYCQGPMSNTTMLTVPLSTLLALPSELPPILGIQPPAPHTCLRPSKDRNKLTIKQPHSVPPFLRPACDTNHTNPTNAILPQHQHHRKNFCYSTHLLINGGNHPRTRNQ